MLNPRHCQEKVKRQLDSLTHLRWHEFLYLDRLLSVRSLYSPFFSTIRALMNLNVRRINTEILSISFLIQFRKNTLPDTIVSPFCKTSIDTLSRTVTLWKLSPLCSTVIHPEYPVQHHPVIFPGASFLPCVFRWEQWLKSFPLFICNVIVIHTFIIAFS